MKFFRVALLSGVLMTSGGCLFQKSPKVQVPVAGPPAPIPAPQEQTPPPPVAATPPPASTPAPTEPAKPSPFPPSTTPANPPPTRAITPPAVRPPQAPALGVVLSAADRAKYENAYKADTDTANSLLTRLGGKGLTAEQSDSLGRARALLKQSAQYHDRDLTTSAELARRARVLLQDLATALK